MAHLAVQGRLQSPTTSAEVNNCQVIGAMEARHQRILSNLPGSHGVHVIGAIRRLQDLYHADSFCFLGPGIALVGTPRGDLLEKDQLEEGMARPCHQNNAARAIKGTQLEPQAICASSSTSSLVSGLVSALQLIVIIIW